MANGSTYEPLPEGTPPWEQAQHAAEHGHLPILIPVEFNGEIRVAWFVLSLQGDSPLSDEELDDETRVTLLAFVVHRYREKALELLCS